MRHFIQFMLAVLLLAFVASAIYYGLGFILPIILGATVMAGILKQTDVL